MAITLADDTTVVANNPPAQPASPATAPPSPAPAAEPTPDWRASLPDDLKSHKALERYKDLGAFVKGHLELETAFGKKVEGMVKLPAPDAEGKFNEAEVTAFRKAIGVPDAPEAYKLEVSEDLQEYVSPDGVAAFQGLFHHLAIPTPAAQAIVQGFAEFSQMRLAAIDQGHRAKLNELKREWGDATYNRRLALAKKVWDTELPESLRELFDTTKIGSHPDLITFLAKYGEDLAESGHIDAQLVTGGVTVTQLEKRKAEILSDPAFVSEREAALNPAKHAALVKEYNDILAQLNPEPRR